ncbi:MAG: 30S ribosomal protein S13 [Candidatus Diapherotrites archaeon CG11_big_fil_rev_8_21_14_0_20_37_9]|nr:MAG: 30S ribosomal protein S13 [Candidatus Diapherotrites archaeon CG11_big_fil_rev_8_21_14_0_20_37_9]
MAEENKKHRAPVKQEEEAKPGQRLIVRVANVDLDGRKNIPRALLKIKGVGIRTAKNIAITFEKNTGLPFDMNIGTLDETQSKKLEEIVVNPGKQGIPKWSLNRRNDFNTGETTHVVTGDLDFAKRKDIQRLGELKSYKGLRHAWHLPVRGQKTKSTHRNKGKTVGVTKKDVKK